VIYLTKEEAFEKLVPWAKARAYGLVAGKHLEDAEQEAYLALWKALNTYNPDSGWQLKTYASTVIRNAIYNFIKKEKRQTDHLTYACNTEDRISDSEDGAEEVMIQYSKNIRIRKACGTLNDREQDVLSNRMLSSDPESLESMAERWGTKKQSILRDESRLKILIKENYNGERL
jgi:RNA polymerase sigma factor (sigma-70 family)